MGRTLLSMIGFMLVGLADRLLSNTFVISLENRGELKKVLAAHSQSENVMVKFLESQKRIEGFSKSAFLCGDYYLEQIKGSPDGSQDTLKPHILVFKNAKDNRVEMDIEVTVNRFDGNWFTCEIICTKHPEEEFKNSLLWKVLF